MSVASYQSLDRHVGNTPLIRLRRLSELTGCQILGKAEFMNPSGSVKDRAAYGIITDAEQQGLLKPGATIVEGTAGNTGIGLTVIGHARGYQTVIVIPETRAPEKIRLFLERTSIRSIPKEESLFSTILSFEIGLVKLGQPVPLSNLSSELKSGSPVMIST